jgi:hypothetical protein
MSFGIYDGIFPIKEQKEIKRFSILNEADEEEGYEWRVTFHLPELAGEYDDDFESFDEQVTIVAIDVDQAVKYAEQYIRVQQKDNSAWKNAEILSVQRM